MTILIYTHNDNDNFQLPATISDIIAFFMRTFNLLRLKNESVLPVVHLYVCECVCVGSYCRAFRWARVSAIQTVLQVAATSQVHNPAQTE